MDKLTISDVVEDDLPDKLSLAREVSELNVFSTLSNAGQCVLKESQDNDIADIVDKEIYQTHKFKAGNKLVAYIA